MTDLRVLAKQEWKALDDNLHKTPRELVVHEALSHVGYTEGSNNDNMFGDYYSFNNVAWCGLFCTYCYWIGAAIALPNTNKGKKGLAYVPSAHKMLDKLGVLTKEPQIGDLVMFDFPGGVSDDHIGIFHKWIDKDRFYCIEGNTSQKGHQSNGGAVEYQIRNKSLVSCFASLEKIKSLNLMP